MPGPSKSRNVNGYVKATLKWRKLRAQYDAKMQALEPLRQKVRDASHQVTIRAGKLTGTQRAEAERILTTIERSQSV